jgi:glycerol-3-phosphate dehydrogenase subunit C
MTQPEMTEPGFDIIRDSLDHCVKCTICESACPVAAVTTLFPGQKY